MISAFLVVQRQENMPSRKIEKGDIEMSSIAATKSSTFWCPATYAIAYSPAGERLAWMSRSGADVTDLDLREKRELWTERRSSKHNPLHDPGGGNALRWSSDG